MKTSRTYFKFDHYYVEKKSDHYYGVYDMCGLEITSGTSMWNACKKAKLLETGYEKAREIYCDFFGWE